MKLVVDIKYYLFKSMILIACFAISTGFTITSDKRTFSNGDTVVSVVQENNDLTVLVKSSKSINIRFYMFTVDGRLIKELNMYGSNKITITQLEKGIYIYDFFSNDKRLKNGKIELR
jgi:hypothetical protein